MSDIVKPHILYPKRVHDDTEDEKKRDLHLTWEGPEPLFQNADLISFPIDSFPLRTKMFVESVSRCVSVPLDMPACVALAVYSLALAGKVEIKVKDDFRESVNLYIIISAKSGSRKSKIFKKIMAPVNEYEQQANDIIAEKIAANEERLMYVDAHIAYYKKEYNRTLDEAAFEKLQEYKKEKEELEDNKELVLYTQDITPEGLAEMLHEQNERLGILSGEGDGFDLLQKRYGGTSSLNLLLQGYTGDSKRSDRKTSKSIHLKNPLLTLCIMAQPQKINEFLSNRENIDRGLAGRILFANSEDIIGTRLYTSESIPAQLSNDYCQSIRKLLAFNPDQPVVLRMTKKAEEMFIDALNKNEVSLRYENDMIKAWGSRKHGFTLRISALLHMANWSESGAEQIPDKIDIETLENSIRIADYFDEHHRALAESSGYDMELMEAKELLRTIIKKEWTNFYQNELFDVLKGRQIFNKAHKLTRGLKVLCEKGYLRILPRDGGKKIGRPRSAWFAVNPKKCP